MTQDMGRQLCPMTQPASDFDFLEQRVQAVMEKAATAVFQKQPVTRRIRFPDGKPIAPSLHTLRAGRNRARLSPLPVYYIDRSGFQVYISQAKVQCLRPSQSAEGERRDDGLCQCGAARVR